MNKLKYVPIEKSAYNNITTEAFKSYIQFLQC